MSRVFCINPQCKQRENPQHLELCQACRTPLLLLGQYQLIRPLRPLDKCIYAEVFEAEDLGIEIGNEARYKVLKVLKYDDNILVRLFEQEADILRNLYHPGIPRVPENCYFTVPIPRRTQPLHCLVMEKVEGEDLLQWVQRNGPISSETALKWFQQLIEILDYLHQNCYFHRDIKPSNIMRRSNDQLVLIDFGTARKITETYIARLGNNEELTRIWSAGYTPEEVMQGRAVPQSDFYALGRTLVHLLTGYSPLELPTAVDQLNWRVRAPEVPPSLAAWIDYLMAESPLERPPDTSFILQYLQGRSLENLPSPPLTPPVPPTQRQLMLLNMVLFPILLVTGWLWFQGHQENQWQILPKENPPAELRRN